MRDILLSITVVGSLAKNILKSGGTSLRISHTNGGKARRLLFAKIAGMN